MTTGARPAARPVPAVPRTPSLPLLLRAALVLVLWVQCGSLLCECTSVSLTGTSDFISAIIMSDVLISYQLIEPSVSVVLSPPDTSLHNRDALYQQQVDFALASNAMTDTEVALYPSVAVFPLLTAAVVPVYRLDALGQFAAPLVFSREALVQLFLGNITEWNDPRLQALNPTVTLPSQAITIVYQNEAAGINLVLTSALAKFDPVFAYQVPASTTPAWPVVIATYLMIDLEYSRTTCAAREAMVQFWLNFYQSSVVASLLDTREYAALPSIVMQQFDLIERLSDDVMCRGDVALPIVASSVRWLAGPSRVTFLVQLLADLYGNVDTTFSLSYMETSSDVAVQQFLNAEVQVAYFVPSEVSAGALAAVGDAAVNLVLPTFLVSLVVTFNPELAAGVNVGSNIVVLRVDELAAIFVRNITDWHHPAIRALNPWLTALFNGSTQPAPITLITGCSANAVLLKQLSAFFLSYAQQWSPTVLEMVLAEGAVLSGFDTCTSSNGIQYTGSEATLEPMVTALPGAVSYKQDDSPSSAGKVAIQYPRMVDGAVVWSVVQSMPDSLRACLSAYDLTDNSLDPQASTNASCYPFTQTVYSVVSQAYAGAGCDAGLDALRCQQWLTTNQNVDDATESRNTVRAASLITVAQTQVDALDLLQCDGQTLLITLPVVWDISGPGQAFGLAAAGIGLVLCVAALAITAALSGHPVFRSASPVFVATSVVGLVLLFMAAIFLIQPASSLSCSGLSWSLNLGFSLTFGPLFAKTWRIYRIFGRKRLSVVKISNRRLGLLVVLLMFEELVLMSVWQAVGPLHPVLTAQWTGSPSAEHDYTQCGVSGAGAHALTYAAATKAVLLGFGALMAFSTRKVSSTFNESSVIAMTIYNVAFSVGIIVPIIVVIGAVGDVLSLLLLFLVLWVSFCTLALLIVPKLLTMKGSGQADGRSEAALSRDSESGFSFLSLGHLTTALELTAYIAALRKHMAQAEARLVDLRRSPSYVPTAKPSTDTTALAASSSPLLLSAAGRALQSSSVTATSASSTQSGPSSSPLLTSSTVYLQQDRKRASASITQSSRAPHPMPKQAAAVAWDGRGAADVPAAGGLPPGSELDLAQRDAAHDTVGDVAAPSNATSTSPPASRTAHSRQMSMSQS